MPGIISPSRADVAPDRILTNIAIANMQGDDGFIASQVFQTVPVEDQAAKYYKFDDDDLNRPGFKPRPPGTESDVVGYTLSKDTYYAEVYAEKTAVHDQIKANGMDILAPDRRAINLLMTHKKIFVEQQWMADYFVQAAPGDVWTFDVDGVASGATAAGSFNPLDNSNNDTLQWNLSSSSPISDIDLGIGYVVQRTGQKPNTLTMGFPVWQKLKRHPEITALIDSGQTPGGPALADRRAVAAILGVEEILVSWGVYNAAKEGATKNNQFIGGKNALLSYRPPSPGVDVPAAGYTFQWDKYLMETGMGIGVWSWYDEKIRARWMECELAYDNKVTSKDLGYFFNGIVA